MMQAKGRGKGIVKFTVTKLTVMAVTNMYQVFDFSHLLYVAKQHNPHFTNEETKRQMVR